MANYCRQINDLHLLDEAILMRVLTNQLNLNWLKSFGVGNSDFLSHCTLNKLVGQVIIRSANTIHKRKTDKKVPFAICYAWFPSAQLKKSQRVKKMIFGIWTFERRCRCSHKFDVLAWFGHNFYYVFEELAINKKLLNWERLLANHNINNVDLLETFWKWLDFMMSFCFQFCLVWYQTFAAKFFDKFQNSRLCASDDQQRCLKCETFVIRKHHDKHRKSIGLIWSQFIDHFLFICKD